MSSKIKLFLHLGHSNLLMGGIFATEQDFFFFLINPRFSQNWASEPLKRFITFLMFMTKPQRPKSNSIQLNILMLALVLTEEIQTHCHF